MTTKLTYFDFDGSRGQECRIALRLCGVAFEDVRLSREQWAAAKPTTPYGAMPIFEHERRKLAQSNAILRYLGASHGLHPQDPWTAAEHDAVMDSVEDLRNKLPGQGLSDEAKKTAREAFASGWLTQWGNTVSSRIRGPLLEGEAIHVADIKLYVIVRSLLSGTFDHIPPSLFDAWPALLAHQAAVAKRL